MKQLLLTFAAVFAVYSAQAISSDAPERADIDDRYKWDLAAFYASADVWEADAERFESMLPALERFKGKLGKNGKTLLEAVRAIEAVDSLISDLYVYAGLKTAEDTRISEHSARFSRVQGLYARYQQATAFVRPELMAIPEDRLQRMIDRTEGLGIYRHYFDETLRMRDYTLTEQEEKIIAAASEPLGKFNRVFSAFDNADIRFGTILDENGDPVELTNSRYGAFIFSADRSVREAAWKGIHSGYEQMGNTLAANYEGHVKSKIFEAKVRGFDSVRHMRTYSNAIPIEVYDNLISVASEGVAPLQRYLELRKEVLGLDTLEIWDMYAPLSTPTIADVSFEEAKDIVANALTPLGEEYVEVFWKGFDEGWVDAFASNGKRGGAYSWGTYNSKPYLSMNYEGTLSDVTTLAHEYGHSIHSYLSDNAQPYVYGNYRIFIAEIASMTNEAILYQKMLASAESREEKLFLLQSYLDDFRGSFFRQASFADFEMRAHKLAESGGALTKDALNQLYAEVFNDYYGEVVNVHPLNASEWSRIPHFLRTDNFYVYQYATSHAAATALAKMILEEGEPARKRYLDMLKSGSSDYPIELLRKAGVDMTTPQPIHDTIAVFESLVDELERTLKAEDSYLLSGTVTD